MPQFGSRRRALAYWLALLLPAGLLAGALVSQYLFGFAPCEMCYWQRWPHWAALALALVAMGLRDQGFADWIVRLAAIAAGISGLIGAFHAGVELNWWDGPTACSATSLAAAADPLDAIMASPLVRCDVAPFRFLGLSMAGWNFALSLGGAVLIWVLLPRRAAARAVPA